MSAPAVPLPAARAMRGKAKQGVDRTAGFVEAWLRTHTLLVYAFLYIPIIVVVVYSFNGTNQRVMHWEGFSFRWYEYVAQNNEVQRYLWNSVIVGLATGHVGVALAVVLALCLAVQLWNLLHVEHWPSGE